MRPHDPGKVAWWWGHKMWRKQLRSLPKRMRRHHNSGAKQRRAMWLMVHS